VPAGTQGAGVLHVAAASAGLGGCAVPGVLRLAGDAGGLGRRPGRVAAAGRGCCSGPAGSGDRAGRVGTEACKIDEKVDTVKGKRSTAGRRQHVGYGCPSTAGRPGYRREEQR
jgi:hypothetical protein